MVFIFVRPETRQLNQYETITNENKLKQIHEQTKEQSINK